MLIRPRRNRQSAAIRKLVEETHLLPQHLVYPLFLVEGVNVKQAIESLPGTFRLSLDELLKTIEKGVALGVYSYVVFPSIPEKRKDKTATFSYSSENFYLEAIRTIKKEFPDVCLISDVALDPYNIDGHDGIVENGVILNDPTLEVLGKMSVAQAQAGIDILGPSDMMDGRVKHIRETLDKNNFETIGIMSYTAKYASSFYGPFRDALDSAPKAGDKKSYQMNPANRREALLEAALDEQEGADFLMVKPALHYLDIISDLKQASNLPIAAYHVSGECAMLSAA
jgi:porphobilinogen synthase